MGGLTLIYQSWDCCSPSDLRRWSSEARRPTAIIPPDKLNQLISEPNAASDLSGGGGPCCGDFLVTRRVLKQVWRLTHKLSIRQVVKIRSTLVLSRQTSYFRIIHPKRKIHSPLCWRKGWKSFMFTNDRIKREMWRVHPDLKVILNDLGYIVLLS